RSGRSKGTAEVVFARRGDAVAAVKKYNNVQLDGKPMKIEILGTNTPTAAAALPANNGGYVRNVAKSAPRGGPAGLP
ncbi:THO complex subunit 4, partial [Shewanella sp. A3A]|nr:THO complex subunit 4 [Shewanella ferrihydritica]